MSTHRARPLPPSTRLVERLALVLVAGIAGLAPFTHLVSAASAPIVHEDVVARSTSRAHAETAASRRRRAVRRRPRSSTGRRLLAWTRWVATMRPRSAAPLVTILRL